VLALDELRRDPEGVARRCAAFLGVGAEGWAPALRELGLHLNAARLPRSRALQRAAAALRRPGIGIVARAIDRLNLVARPYPPLSPALRRRINQELADEIARLGSLTGLDVSGWLADEEEIAS